MDSIKSQPAENPLVLALDVGTSSVRGALYDSLGQEVAGTHARLKRTLHTTFDGGAEIDAAEAIEQVAQTVDAVLAHAEGARIDLVAISCFWHSLVGVDISGRPLTPVYGWADTRAARHALELRRHVNEHETHLRTGCRFHPSYWPAKLLWLREERAEVYSSVRRWLSFGEMLALAFFGETAASVSMASGTGLLNTSLCVWDEELLEVLGLRAEQLPPLAETERFFKGLRDEYARRWPQLREAQWFPAVADGAANNVGAGCCTRRTCALMVGTSGAMRVMWEGEPPLALPSSLWCYRVDRRRVLVGGALSDGGGLFGWMKDSLNLGGDLKDVEEEVARMEPDAHGLTVMPFWAGERSTGWCGLARGAVLGLTMHTRPVEILRASMEAVAYRFALIARALDELAPGAQVFASGGALSASPAWAQMLADVLGRPLGLSGVAEASSRGAVLLALEAVGKLKSIERAPTPPAESYEPDRARHLRYLAGLERQQSIYERLVADEEVAAILSEAARATDDELQSTPSTQPE